MRSSPSIRASARIRSARPRPPSAQAFTFWPSSTISRAPRIDQRMRLGDDVPPRPRDLGAAGVGHDAISAEFVAAFLHGQECAGRGPAARGQGVELADRAACRCRPAGAAHGLRDHLGQAVIGLRADDHVDLRRAAHRSRHPRPGRRSRPPRSAARAVLVPQAADVRIGLFGRLLADMAGVEHDEIGLVLAAAAMPCAVSSSAMRSPS